MLGPEKDSLLRNARVKPRGLHPRDHAQIAQYAGYLRPIRGPSSEMRRASV